MPRKRKIREFKPGEVVPNLIDGAIKKAATKIADAKYRIQQDERIIDFNQSEKTALEKSRKDYPTEGTGKT